MPSIFSRTRTQSTPKLNGGHDAGVDEFGQRTTKKSKTLPPPPPVLPDGAFLPAYFPVDDGEEGHGYLSHRRTTILSPDHLARLTEVVCEELGSRGGLTTPFIFSSLSVDLSLSRIKRLIDKFLDTCLGEGASGNAGRERDEAERLWREEARFASLHDLGVVLRWGLARVLRIQSGIPVRGLVPLPLYDDWARREDELSYPPTHFPTLLPTLIPPIRSVLLTLLSLLTRLTANSATSGHTPPTLSPLFGPLIFGLAPPQAGWEGTYKSYLLTLRATEHILLSFIRWQDTPRGPNGEDPSNNLTLGKGVMGTLAVPRRLKDWIRDYPASLRRTHGGKTVRVVNVRRNVRGLSRDLIKNASGWGYIPPPPLPMSSSTSAPTAPFSASREWGAITTGKIPPKYSDPYRKRLALPSSYQPLSSISSYPSAASSNSASTLSLGSTLVGSEEGTTGKFGSLTELKWGEFETKGFGGLGTDHTHTFSLEPYHSVFAPTRAQARLNRAWGIDGSSLNSGFGVGSTLGKDTGGGDLGLDFSGSTTSFLTATPSTVGAGAGGLGGGRRELDFDLTESARQERASKRQTLSWNDFSSAGFSRGDKPLDATLQFTTILPPSSSLPSTPTDPKKLLKKKGFGKGGADDGGVDMVPFVGGEHLIEEPFLDVFCDLIHGSGWDLPLPLAGQPGKEGNWVLVEFKSLPPSAQSAPATNGADPRTGTTLLLFEEFLFAGVGGGSSTSSANDSARKRLPSLFSSSTSSKGDKESRGFGLGLTKSISASASSPAPSPIKTHANTFNGHGHGPPLDFEAQLLSGNKKVLTLGRKDTVNLGVGTAVSRPVSSATTAAGPMSPSEDIPPVPPLPPLPHAPSTPRKEKDKDGDDLSTPRDRRSKFRLPIPAGGIAALGGGGGTPKREPAGFEEVEFDVVTRGESNSDDDAPLSNRARRERSEDAWVDILVGSQARRMDGQQATLRPSTEREKAKERRRAGLVGGGGVGAGGPDAEEASREVEKALLGVRMSDDEDFSPPRHRLPPQPTQPVQQRHQRQESEYSDLEPVDVDMDAHLSHGIGQGRSSISGSDADELGAGRPSVESSYTDYGDGYGGEDDDDDGGSEDSPARAALARLRAQRAATNSYFNAHPDRARMSTASEDPRSRLAYDDSDGEGEDDRDDELGAGRFEPRDVTGGGYPLPPTSVPAPPPVTTTPPTNTAGTSPPRVGSVGGPRPKPNGAAGAGGGVGSLIEMYREKERSASTPSAPATAPPTQQPSRLPVPVRPAAGLPKSPAPEKAIPAPPVLAPAAEIKVEKKEVVKEGSKEKLDPPTLPATVTDGRASPARYIHGAPLHNVLEEEEEE